MPQVGRGHTTLGPTPGHDRRALSQSPLENLIPPDQPSPLRRNDLLDAPDEITLELLDVFQPFNPDSRLAPRALAPGIFRHLIPAHMNEFGREQVNDFRDDVPVHLEDPVVTSAQGRREPRHTFPERIHFQGLPPGEVAGQLRVRSQRFHGVAGHLDLRNHRDVTFFGVSDELAHFLLGVEATAAAVAVGKPRAHRGQSRVLLDFQPPALVIRQVQVENIQFVQGHAIDSALDISQG